MFAGRSVIEILVLTFTALVAFAVLFGTLAIVVVELVNPEADTSSAIDGLSSIITGILGALLGLLAGKAEVIGKEPE